VKGTDIELELMAKQLAESGEYRILRRLRPRPPLAPPIGSEVIHAVCVDVETTGLDLLEDEIIELAMVPFNYTRDGTILDVQKSFAAYSQPKKPIAHEITALTGITNQMVEGERIDECEVNEFLRDTRLVISHNAAFDRCFLDRVFPIFQRKNWACSMSQIDWAAEGYEGTKLAYLAMKAGFFYESHRAENDCYAAIELLATVLQSTGAPAMTSLLQAARAVSWRVEALNSTFEKKDALKVRGYRWNRISKCWYVDVADNALADEEKWLADNNCQSSPYSSPRRITAMNRFSERA
jgi:DNA polymerase-3 subunit epsilon